MAGRTKNSRLNAYHTFDGPFWVGVDIDWHVLRPLAIHHSKGVAEARSNWAPSEREINHGLGAVKTPRPPVWASVCPFVHTSRLLLSQLTLPITRSGLPSQ